MTSQKNKKRQSSPRATDSPDFFTVSKRALIGGAIALGSALLLSLSVSALCLLFPDPASLTLPIGIAIYFISSAVGGAASAIGLRVHPKAAVASALFCGFMLAIVTGICALWQSAAAPEASHGMGVVISTVIRMLSLPTAEISAYLVTRKAKKHRRRPR
jgi:hypothetical protein